MDRAPAYGAGGLGFDPLHGLKDKIHFLVFPIDEQSVAKRRFLGQWVEDWILLLMRRTFSPNSLNMILFDASSMNEPTRRTQTRQCNQKWPFANCCCMVRVGCGVVWCGVVLQWCIVAVHCERIRHRKSRSAQYHTTNVNAYMQSFMNMKKEIFKSEVLIVYV